MCQHNGSYVTYFGDLIFFIMLSSEVRGAKKTKQDSCRAVNIWFKRLNNFYNSPNWGNNVLIKPSTVSLKQYFGKQGADLLRNRQISTMQPVAWYSHNHSVLGKMGTCYGCLKSFP